ncbi:MAG: hypothetical protein KF770_10490 [Anaerolineae bacterium]|nr:hypothetical protein [Anaerolineae bacterium]
MINWQALLFNAFWIVGLAVLCAALSYHHWAAHQTKTSFKTQLNQPAFLVFFWLSFALVCVGLAGTSRQLWETAVWVIFTGITVLFMAKAFIAYRLVRSEIRD